MQELCPLLDWYLPAAQVLHELCALLDWYLPGAQLLHEVLEWPEEAW